MMIDNSPWPLCSSQSPWLPCSGHTISSTGPSVSPFRDFWDYSFKKNIFHLFHVILHTLQGSSSCIRCRIQKRYSSTAEFKAIFSLLLSINYKSFQIQNQGALTFHIFGIVLQIQGSLRDCKFLSSPPCPAAPRPSPRPRTSSPGSRTSRPPSSLCTTLA